MGQHFRRSRQVLQYKLSPFEADRHPKPQTKQKMYQTNTEIKVILFLFLFVSF